MKSWLVHSVAVCSDSRAFMLGWWEFGHEHFIKELFCFLFVPSLALLGQFLGGSSSSSNGLTMPISLAHKWFLGSGERACMPSKWHSYCLTVRRHVGQAHLSFLSMAPEPDLLSCCTDASSRTSACRHQHHTFRGLLQLSYVEFHQQLTRNP